VWEGVPGLSHPGRSAKARRKKQPAGSLLDSGPARLECPMIPRYTGPEMASGWEPQTRLKIRFEIEAHAADAQAELGVIPKDAARTIWAKAGDVTFNVERLDEIERET